MSPQEPRLLSDGGVFLEEIVVPDMVIRSEDKPEQDVPPTLEAEEEPPAGEPSA